MGLMDTVRSSIAASKKELERNTGNTGAYSDSVVPIGVEALAANRKKLGISATDPLPLPIAGQVLAPTGVATPPEMLPPNAQASGYSIAKPIAEISTTAPVAPPPKSATIQPFDMTGYDNKRDAFVNANNTAGITTIPGGSMTVSGAAPITQMVGKNADGTPFDNNAAFAGIKADSDSAKQADMNSAVYNQQVAEATRRNAIEKEYQANKSVGQRINDMERSPDTWGLGPINIAAAAQAGFNGQQKKLADDKALTGQLAASNAVKYGADKQKDGAGITAQSHVKAAELTAEGREKASLAAHKGTIAEKANEADLKLYEKYLQSGYTPDSARAQVAVDKSPNGRRFQFETLGTDGKSQTHELLYGGARNKAEAAAFNNWSSKYDNALSLARSGKITDNAAYWKGMNALLEEGRKLGIHVTSRQGKPANEQQPATI